MAVGGATATVAVGGAAVGATLAGAAASGASVLLGTTLVIAGVTAIGATCVTITEHVRTLTDKKFEERVDVATRELKKRYPTGLMFRAQTKESINQSLTPKPWSDKDGLSFFNAYGILVENLKNGFKGVFITSYGLVTATNKFTIKISGKLNSHYSVMPIPATRLPEWKSTYYTADTNAHEFTKIIRSVCVYVAM